MRNRKWWWIAPVLTLCASQAGAASFGIFDPRSMAMGGTGVADAMPAAAGYYNPALLAVPRPAADRLGLALPSVTATLADPDSLRTNLNDYQADQPKFSDAIAAFQASPTQGNADTAAAAGRTVLRDLESMSDKDVQADINGGAAAALPGPRLGMALTLNARMTGGAMLHVTQSDITAINAAINKIQSRDPAVTDPTQSLTSAVRGTGAALAEAGVSLAHRFSVAGVPVAVGLTPKLVRVQTFDYVMDVNTASFSLNNGRKSYTDFNMDLGVAAAVAPGWRAGVTVKNIIAKDYATVLNDVVKIRPAARAGLAFTSGRSTVALDLDLTANAGTGLAAATRYIALGGEYDLWGWAQLRAGYRYNLLASNTSAASLGVGISPFGIHMDLAAMASSRVVGAAFETGVRF